MIFIIQMKDDEDEDFDVLCKIEASSEMEAFEEVKKNYRRYEDVLKRSEVLIHPLNTLTKYFYDD